MGRASSNKKVARAARTAGRTKSSRNLVWPLAMVAVVGLGAVLIFLSRPDEARAEPPILGDHWHVAYGVFTCGQFQPPYSDIKTDTSGIHGHGDGLIHIHPFSTRYTGDGATLGAFGEQVGLVIEDDRLVLPSGTDFSNGDDCGGEPGVVQVKVWADGADNEGRLLDGDFADFDPDNGSLVTIAFAPEGAELPKPPSAGTVPSDLPGGAPVGGQPTDGSTPTPTSAVDPSTASTDTSPPPTEGAPGGDPSATSTPPDGGGASTTAPAQ